MDYAAEFHLGQIVEHRRFGYRGLVFGVDADFQLSEEWYEAVAKSRPPKDKPWYHVLVDGESHTTYVAQRHLAPSTNHAQIAHPLLGDYFNRYDGQRYYPSQGLN